MARLRKCFNFDAITVGELLGQRRFVVTDQIIRDCAFAIEATRDWYLEASPFADRVAPPTLFDNESLRMLDECYERFGSIHARQAWQFLAPIVRGTTVDVKVTVTDKFIKRGGQYIVMDLIAHDDEGKALCRGQHTSLMSLNKEG
jgi:acyl dehydratase